MRILLASKRAPGTPGRRDGGVQTWTSTVAAELRRLGHEVEVADVATLPQGRYDVGIFANARYIGHMARLCGRSLLVCHGIVPDEEPAAGFGAVAFTSEEVRDDWGVDGPVIRQPVDLEFWSPGPGAGGTLVRYANRGGLDWLPAVAERLGLEFRHVCNATPEQARDALRGAACVLSSGRCAVEAMACGAPVVVCDDRPYQGPLIEYAGGARAMQHNYSGRGGGRAWPDRVETEVRAAWEDPDGVWRGIAEREHDARKIVPKLLAAAA